MTEVDLTSYVQTHFDKEEDQAKAWVLTLLYLIENINANEWQTEIKLIVNSLNSAKEVRLKLTSNGYFFCIKMLLLECVFTDAKPTSLCKKWNVSIRDAKSLNLDVKSPYIIKAVKSRLKGFPKNFNFDWRPTFAAAYPSIYTYIKYLAFSKLRFIAKSSNCKVSDLYPELLEPAMKSFHRLWPTQVTPLHLSNFIKRSVHNAAINYIKSETTLKRGRLVRVGVDKRGNDVFSLLEVGEAKLGLNQGGETDLVVEDLQCDSDLQHLQFKFELELSVKSILDKYKVFPKKYKFLFILLGNYDEGFTTWLRWRHIASLTETNEDVQDKLDAASYNSHLSAFLHINETKSNVFLLKIGQKMGYSNIKRNEEVACDEPERKAA
jgi:hypothetical protein